jgi:two-component system response regulator PrrA
VTRILVVDDDQDVLDSLERGLLLCGFQVDAVNSPTAALQAIAEHPPHAIVLDVTMPEMSGIQLCRRIRDAGLDIPICILSARGNVEDRVEGLRAGGDDYLVKPFALEELRLRLEGLLKRSRSMPVDDRVLRVGSLEIDTSSRQVRVKGDEVELSKREFELLELLARNSGIVLSRSQLLADVWGYDFPVETNVVAVFIGYLRKKLEEGRDVKLIHTVRGVGFVLRS